jgi:hypothetical protein
MDLIYFLKDFHIYNSKYNNEYHLKDDFIYLFQTLPESIKSKNLNLNSTTCNFIIKSGLRRFLPCGHPTISNSEYCLKHNTYIFKKENPKEYKELKKEEKHLKLIKEENKKPKVSIVAYKQIKENNSILLVKNKFNNILWPNSKLVFKSFKEKIIIGTEDEIGNIISLKTEDIELCKQYKLKYNIQN